jgi:hypothetical protein
VLQELRHEIEAYQKFCEFQETADRDPAETERKRIQLQNRMRRDHRLERDRRRTLRTSGQKAKIGLW